MTPPLPPSPDHSLSHSDSENFPVLDANTSRADLVKVGAQLFEFPHEFQLTSCDRVSEIARQYQVDKNAAQAELKHVSRKLADITNDSDDNSNSGHRSKRRRRRAKHPSPPTDSDEEDMDPINRADEHFVFQAGHKFFLVCAPWIRTGDDLFEHDVDEDYNAAERFENDNTKSQGQLQDILNLLQARFPPQALQQRWLRRQVRFINIP